jgi:hypothetical protein
LKGNSVAPAKGWAIGTFSGILNSVSEGDIAFVDRENVANGIAIDDFNYSAFLRTYAKTMDLRK